MIKENTPIVVIAVFTVLGLLGIFLLVGNKENPGAKTSQVLSTSAQKESSVSGSKGENMRNPNSKTYASAPEMGIDPNKNYSAVLHTTVGDITITFFAKENPITVNNFVFLARDTFYNGTRFHRVIKNFMIQGGDPLGNGTGGPGYSFKDEPITRDYKRGIVAMANSGPNTNGSQFFIMQGDTPLPKQYVIFGEVTNGIQVVDRIGDAPVVQSASGEMSKPVTDVIITKVDITEQ